MDCMVYLLQCRDGTYYCGWTNDLEKRLNAHNAGTASKYTRKRRPVRLIYTEKHLNRSECQKREYAIKQLSRAEKEQLIESNSRLENPKKQGLK
ncbi:MAG: GIY-YIG nuclease family protein [Candidatus Diapherotrites archaeon]|uniref:GIY-YIG nuclease family protein n=1 Tax=Candidatus Iainarchaeum sp. TaxID=3101447 RepID=A0A8T4L383_9ARCH|nr:GIY-YIG nuclease family protein [Candidatus Diapherotrites archaeon]